MPVTQLVFGHTLKRGSYIGRILAQRGQLMGALHAFEIPFSMNTRYRTLQTSSGQTGVIFRVTIKFTGGPS
jgi:hypothetical protein